MMITKDQPLPGWLKIWIWRALIGQIYPNIRAIAASFSDEKELKVRYYLDRPPTGFDHESLGDVMTEILANASSNGDIKSVSEECVYSDAPFSQMDVLGEFVYARREHDLE